jgi:hypothetical protein
VKIVVTNQKGEVVATRYGPSNEGVNRFLWDLRYDGTRRLESAIPPEPPEPGEPERARFYMEGPHVLPGEYTISVTVNGQTEKTTTRVLPDPNLHVNPEDFRAQTEAALNMRNQMAALNEMIERIERMQRQIADFEKSAGADSETKAKYGSLLQQAQNLDKKLEATKSAVYNPAIQHNVEEDDIHALSDLHGQIRGLAEDLASSYDEPPNALVREKMAKLTKDLNERLTAFNDLLKDVAEYNKAAYAAGAPTLFSGDTVIVKKAPEL